MAATNTDRSLLFAVLAFQLRFISSEALVKVIRAWKLDPSQKLSDLLVEQGALDPQDRAPIEMALQRHLNKRQDAARCLTELDFQYSAELLAQLEDLDASLKENQFSREGGKTGHSDHRSDATTAWGESPTADQDDGFVLDEGVARTVTPERFRVVRPHARGGLGEVHLAWDEELGRYVALKEMRAEYAQSPALRARFEREAEVNGKLEHPGIVPVHGMGRHVDGRPYYAMRFVRGETLQKALDRFHEEESAELSPTQWAVRIRHLIRPFLVVCDAIAYAHSRGVLHRDLKPSNIMLGPFGETLIIDWGLAKVTGHAETATSGELGRIPLAPLDDLPHSTIAGETLGSPPYMSPEQARGEHDHLTPATDIYSLGATLFTILAGRPSVEGASSREVVAKVIRGEIDRPGAVEPRIPPALEAICQKAMRLDPNDRYKDARELAADLERWMADQPVSVYHDPLSTRLLRWAQRRKSFVSAGLALLVTTIVGLAIANLIVSQQKRRAEDATTLALVATKEAEAAKNRARDHLQIGLAAFEELITAGDRQLIAQATGSKRGEFLEKALSFIQRFAQSEPDNLEVRERAASLSFRLANLYLNTGRPVEAEQFFDGAVTSLETLQKERPGNQRLSANLNDRLAEALLYRAGARVQTGNTTGALQDVHQAEALCRENLQAEPDSPPYLRTLGHVLDTKAMVLLSLGQIEAISASREATAILTPLADFTLPLVRSELESGRRLSFNDQILLADALLRQSTILSLDGDVDTAEQVAALLRDRIRRLTLEAGDPSIESLAFASAYIDVNLRLLGRPGLHTDADSSIQTLLSLSDKNPEMLSYRLTLTKALEVRAADRMRSRNPEAASDDADQAFVLIEGILAEIPRLVEAWTLRARILQTLTQLSPATPDLERALKKAIEFSLERAIALNPANKHLLAELATIRSQVRKSSDSSPP